MYVHIYSPFYGLIHYTGPLILTYNYIAYGQCNRKANALCFSVEKIRRKTISPSFLFGGEINNDNRLSHTIKCLSYTGRYNNRISNYTFTSSTVVRRLFHARVLRRPQTDTTRFGPRILNAGTLTRVESVKSVAYTMNIIHKCTNTVRHTLKNASTILN